MICLTNNERAEVIMVDNKPVYRIYCKNDILGDIPMTANLVNYLWEDFMELNFTQEVS